jgi:hypothetical protein
LKAQGIINYTVETEEWTREILDAPLEAGTPPEEKTDTRKGDVTDENDGNSGAATDNAEG